LSYRIDSILTVTEPTGRTAPVVFDSPHSGTVWPGDFDTIVPLEVLRKSEDMFVDELFADVPDQGAVLIAALFPRAYIDPNRGLADLDQRLLESPWPEPLKPGDKSRMGHGLVWRICPPDYPMYDRRLSTIEVQQRIDSYWQPYHDALSDVMNDLHQDFGAVWHVNCHSMPAATLKQAGLVNGRQRADFVLGDRDGSTCDRDFTALVADTLTEMGYRVNVNDPYKGVELIRAFSNPRRNRHSIQIEVNRSLYMDEVTFQRNGSFESLRVDMARLADIICAYASEQTT